MKSILAIVMLTSALSALAEVCTYSLKKDTSTLTWTAFKTPKKVGVNASFKTFEILTKEAADINAVIAQASFSVDTNSVDSGNPDRDAKIKKHFFKTDLKKVTVSGKVLSLKDGVAQVEFKINDKTKTVPMTVIIQNEEATIAGKIDVLDFALDSSLKAINEACKALHEGKTWSDVDLTVKAQFTKTCK